MRGKFFTVFFCAVALHGLTNISLGQQQILFTQYMFNGLALNPAYAGSDSTLNLTILAREQWLGFDEAPTNQMFSGHTSLGLLDRMGLGLQVEREKIAVTEVLNFYASYAYKIPIGRGKLAMGLQAGVTNQKQNLSDLALPPGVTDPSLDENVSTLLPNFGGGLYYRTSRFDIGFSVPFLVQNSFDKSDIISAAQQLRHYFLSGGYLFDLSPSLKFRPHVLVKSVTGAPVNFDLSANFFIKEMVWVGLSLRNLNSLNTILGMQLSKRLKIGLAYDFVTSDLGQVNSGSGEFMLNYRVFKGVPEKVISPRYF
ncbi:type IX secretion system membrane protein PorP/SprF [Fulvivirga sp. M361]|uniref:PorP/SprF family type IX secretion system membrane protein n=1 Tax=Fulvivirga sp. M361 TaxID=2594266 RepID=UPI00117A0232|nr:type IX secretion system membrane protein PorP/SprF [Fulvivirga sp. M361]TRX49699.1 type IX secretion system membrane protein PorP/SprF [Fulvivirga sp. M361]